MFCNFSWSIFLSCLVVFFCSIVFFFLFIFFFQAEDGIRDLVRSRGLGDVYKRQLLTSTSRSDGVLTSAGFIVSLLFLLMLRAVLQDFRAASLFLLSLIHI